MKDSIRRLVLFIAIVGLGSVMILVDIPLIYMILLVVAVGILLLFALGTITVAEIRTAVSALKSTNFRTGKGKKAALPAPASEKKSALAKAVAEKKPEKPATKKPTESPGGIKGHLSLLASSIGSLGKILSESRKPKKKVEDIDKLLDRTITEKVSRSSALENAAAIPTAPVAGGGAGREMPEGGEETDPFLSLSSEELETGLLDGLEDADLPAPASSPGGGNAPPQESADAALSMPDLDMPPLPDETTDDASAILAAHAAEDGAEELPGLEGADEAVSENLGDLDSINLDEIDLGDDSAMMETAPGPAPIKATGPAPGSGSLVPATPITAAAGADSGEDQGDISSFAAGTAPNSDEDMLSSLASDIKTVKKEKDVSLLRELKDFKAPATDIEKELSDIAEQMNTAASNGAKKRDSPAMGIK
jgi:hypothetical protein